LARLHQVVFELTQTAALRTIFMINTRRWSKAELGVLGRCHAFL